MCKEYVLRDNEIAINRPDGTVIIMNLNAYRALAGDSDEVKALRQKVEKIKAINAEVVKAHNSCLDELNRLKEKAAAYKARIKNLQDDIDMCDEEIHKLKKDRDAFATKVGELTNENAQLREKLTAARFSQKWTREPSLVFWGTPNVPSILPKWIYITDKGEIFLNQKDIERKYNLAKDSVSALMSYKQSLLYPRDAQNHHIVKNGKTETMNVVCTCSDNIFEGRNPNKPNLTKYSAAIYKAKQEMCNR